MDPELIALLARLAELTPEELADLDARLLAYFAQVDKDGPSEDLDQTAHAALLEEIAAAHDQVVTETTARETAEAEAEAEAERVAQEAQAEAERIAQEATDRAEAARRRIAGETEEEGETEEQETEGATDEEKELVTAGAKGAKAAGAKGVRKAPLGGMSARQAGATKIPKQPDGPRVRSGYVVEQDVRGFAAGTELTNLNDIAKAIFARLDGMRGLSTSNSGQGEQVLVASARVDYPKDRFLDADDPSGNYAKIEAVASDEAIVAAGGLCAPLPVDYTIPEVGDLGRPFRDGKPQFGADRGGIRTNVPPSLTDADAGVGVWTLANDADPGGADVPVGEAFATKPVVEFDCGDAVESYVYGMTFRGRFNNMRARFNPEIVASNIRMGMVSHARLAERRLMTLQVAMSTAVSTAALLGASKDFFAHLDVICERYRYRQRRARTTPLIASIPGWVQGMLRADFVRQMPAGPILEQYAIADGVMAQMFAARNVQVKWLMEDLDDQAGAGATGGIGLTQVPGAVLAWPDTVRWFLEFAGEVLFLDGGQLDLGVVRDSALNAVNKYEIFFETFEGLHFRGAEKPLVVTSTLNPNGSAAGLVATATGNATSNE